MTSQESGIWNLAETLQKNLKFHEGKDIFAKKCLAAFSGKVHGNQVPEFLTLLMSEQRLPRAGRPGP